MKSKRKIRQDDKERAVLTELIPYEVPLRLSFVHLYSLLKNENGWSYWVNRLFEKSSDDFVSYSYSVRHGEGKERRLGMIHPLLFRSFADIYYKNSGLILHLCGKSSWSLRRPVRVAKMYIVKDALNTDNSGASAVPPSAENIEDEESEMPVEEEDTTPTHGSSFFVYQPHNLLQKFFESKELLALERRFSNYRRIDVAKCFNNIYTHSLSWAVKGKMAAKQEKQARHTFDAVFDRLMQRSNHGETHGILIGAEISRIFAEIIFQEIDIRVSEKVEREKVATESEYTVRRYIDDYFIFYNDEKVANAVQAILELELSNYKLFINESKRAQCQRPFMTQISSAKVHLNALLAKSFEFVSSAAEPSAEEGGKPPKPRKFVATRVLNQIRLVLIERQVEYPDVSSFLLKHLQVLVKKTLPAFRDEKTSIPSAEEWLRCILETSFFVFAVDVRFRTSILLTGIISDIIEACAWLPDELVSNTCNVIIRETTAVLRQSRKGKRESQLELANFLIGLRDLKEYWRIPSDVLETLWLPELNEKRQPDYFTTVAILFFTSGRPEYAKLINSIQTGALERVINAASVRENTELFCLALDLLSCPWMAKSSKFDLAKKLMTEIGTPNPNESELGEFIKQFSTKTWLFDWRSNVSTKDYLRKKELSLSY